MTRGPERLQAPSVQQESWASQSCVLTSRVSSHQETEHLCREPGSTPACWLSQPANIPLLLENTLQGATATSAKLRERAPQPALGACLSIWGRGTGAHNEERSREVMRQIGTCADWPRSYLTSSDYCVLGTITKTLCGLNKTFKPCNSIR